MSVTASLKSIQDIMRKDVGVDGDAQRLFQLAWMLFLYDIFQKAHTRGEYDEQGGVRALRSLHGWFQQWADTMFLSEPLLGRLLGYGTVSVCTIGGSRFKFDFLPNPHLFHAALQRAMSQAKAPAAHAPKQAPLPQDDSRYMPKG